MTAIEQLIEDMKNEKAKHELNLQSCFNSLAESFSREGGPMWLNSSIEQEWKILKAKIETLTECIKQAELLMKFEASK